MNSSCERHGLLCSCVDWEKAELPAMVNHLLRHFRFLRYELHYGTLASEEGRELCMIGQCMRCGNQLCYGTALPAEVSTDTFLAAVYRWAYTMPLTTEESDFAAEHHDVILRYLRKARLPYDEFYDIAVFGYLRAVRKYLARPELQQYQFTTIAFRAMSCDVHHSREYWMRAKRSATVTRLDEDSHTDDLRDTVTEAVDKIISFEEYVAKLSPVQRRIASLRDCGYSDREIANACGLSCDGVKQEMEDARCRIVDYPQLVTEQAA